MEPTMRQAFEDYIFQNTDFDLDWIGNQCYASTQTQLRWTFWQVLWQHNFPEKVLEILLNFDQMEAENG